MHRPAGRFKPLGRVVDQTPRATQIRRPEQLFQRRFLQWPKRPGTLLRTQLSEFRVAIEALPQNLLALLPGQRIELRPMQRQAVENIAVQLLF